MYSDLVEIKEDLIEKVMNITFTDYDVISLYNREKEKETYINIDNLLVALEDLLNEYNHLQEEYDDFKQDVQDNYRPIPIDEQV